MENTGEQIPQKLTEGEIREHTQFALDERRREESEQDRRNLFLQEAADLVRVGFSVPEALKIVRERWVERAKRAKETYALDPTLKDELERLRGETV